MASWLESKGLAYAAKKPVANQDLWAVLDGLNAGRSVAWQWVKGHAGHEQNERVDGLANAEAERAAVETGCTDGVRYGFKPVG